MNRELAAIPDFGYAFLSGKLYWKPKVVFRS
jgi:hypothetical protein